MVQNGKIRKKASSAATPRKKRIVCLVSDEELRIVDCYLKKYKITNKARWFRETLLAHIYQQLESDYPTLFNEHDMRR